MSKGAFRVCRDCVDQIINLKQIGTKKHATKNVVYVGFMDLEKTYDMVNRAALWQVLRCYGVSGKLLSRIKNMYADSLACARIKKGKSGCVRSDSGVKQYCIMSPWFFSVYYYYLGSISQQAPLQALFSVYMDTVMKDVGMGRRGRAKFNKINK